MTSAQIHEMVRRLGQGLIDGDNPGPEDLRSLARMLRAERSRPAHQRSRHFPDLERMKIRLAALGVQLPKAKRGAEASESKVAEKLSRKAATAAKKRSAAKKSAGAVKRHSTFEDSESIRRVRLCFGGQFESSRRRH
jgi:hypothetical protein